MPQIDTYRDYVPNPWPPTTPGSPCDNSEATPQKVCGVVTSSPGTATLELQWGEFTRQSSGTPNAATALLATPLLVRQVSISAASGNSANVDVGPTSAADLMSIGAGLSGYEIPMPDGTVFDLADWHLKSTAATQTLTIAYLPA